MKNAISTKKLIINSLLLCIGLILHQITPAFGLPIQPDLSLIMLFTIMILNKDDYKMILICGIATGIFAALTTKFPGGQIPNILDKTITTNIVYCIMLVLYKIKGINNLAKEKQDLFVAIIILPIGTLISGTLFLTIAKVIVGLPAGFMVLFSAVVIPAIFINAVVGIFLLKVVKVSLGRTSYNLN